jgi:PAS domain S-box-containing protein
MSTPNPFKILVVDDTEATQYALARVLTKDGFEVATASTGCEALKLVEEFGPDLITLDIHLPDMSGFEVCQKIKSNETTAHTAILQISASYVSSHDRIYGLEGGADGYLTHPVEGAVLIATIRSLLRLRAVGESLRASEERLRLAVENTQLGTWDYSTETKELHWSDQCKKIFGFEEDSEVTYEQYLKSLHPDDENLMSEKIQLLLESCENNMTTEHRIVLPDGSIRWILGRGAAHYKLVNSERKIDRIIGTVLDITDRKSILTDLQKAKEAAESANKAKTQFIANVSHEIRTPLGAILGFSDLMMDGSDLSEEKKEYMQIIQRNAVQLSHLIDEILDLSKVEADKMAIEQVPFNFTELVSDLASVFGMKAQEKSLSLTITLDKSIPSILIGDPVRWRQILINLLNNAIKFTDSGSVELRISPVVPIVSGTEISLEFDVIDTGIGLTQAQTEKLFEPFVQADNSMTRRFGGTGLGLSLSRKLARAMKGELILLKSESNKGTTFRLTLDSSPPTSVSAMAEPVASPLAFPRNQQENRSLPLKDYKILVVEDAKDNQIILERLLTRLGAVVAIAENGHEGIQKAQLDNYDVILMDLQMPGMDGYKAVHTLRASSYERPVIALTAHALKGERERCLQAGFSDYLTKPIDRELLISKICLSRSV